MACDCRDRCRPFPEIVRARVSATAGVCGKQPRAPRGGGQECAPSGHSPDRVSPHLAGVEIPKEGGKRAFAARHHQGPVRRSMCMIVPHGIDLLIDTYWLEPFSRWMIREVRVATDQTLNRTWARRIRGDSAARRGRRALPVQVDGAIAAALTFRVAVTRAGNPRSPIRCLAPRAAGANRRRL